MVIEIKNRWGPAIRDTDQLNRLMSLCQMWLYRHGFAYSDIYYADHISWDPDEDQFTLILFKRLITLRADGATEEELDDEDESRPNSLAN